MYLSSLTFTMIALPVILLVYYFLPKNGKNIFLLCISLLIYGWGSITRVLFLAAYLCYDYGVGMLLQKLSQKKLLCRSILLISVVLQGYLLTTLRLQSTEDTGVWAPLGIALYTLQGLGYLIGIYRKKHDSAVNFIDFALYLTFFPILYAGPLISYREFSEQLRNRKCNILSLGEGLGLFIRGLAEKVVLADTLGYVFREMHSANSDEVSMLTAWLTVTSFSLYLYFELFGYADMARGLGKCFGISLPKNFGQPFFSSSVTAFVESWNITQVLWFQKNFRYFIFSGINHKWVKYASLILMWALIGWWYGSTSMFLLWGCFIGVLLTMEQLFLGKLLAHNYMLGLCYTAVSLQFAWVLFFAEDFSEASMYWRAMLGFGGGLVDQFGMYFFTSYIVVLLICFYIATDLFRNITERIAATAIGQKIASFFPLLDSVLLIFCLAFMLNTEAAVELWLRL